jgi:phosphomevalonate kinase
MPETHKMLTVASAPGKVMVAGGYVVLERPNAALVAAVSARIYTAVKDAGAADVSASTKRLSILVKSEQMGETRKYEYGPDKQLLLEPGSGMPPNPYIEASVCRSLMVIEQLGGRLDSNLEISIYGDNAFYSIPETAPDGSPPPRFAKIARKVDASESGSSDKVAVEQQQHAAEVQKTGLGSSAALVTSIVGALLAHSGAVALPEAAAAAGEGAAEQRAAIVSGEEALALVHNLAQLCHCTAQVTLPTRAEEEGSPMGAGAEAMRARLRLALPCQSQSNEAAFLHSIATRQGDWLRPRWMAAGAATAKACACGCGGCE